MTRESTNRTAVHNEDATPREEETLVRPAIDPKQPLPVYVQLKTLLLEEILSGQYGPGERLPTEHELCARYGISRTPVNRALSELADEGVVLRHRRRGSFVNPHWVQRHPALREARIIVPDGCWEAIVREAAPADLTLNIVSVALPDLHQVIIRAVAEGRAPDLAVLDSVWVHEFAKSGFLTPLDELDTGWVRDEYEQDFLEPFRSANTLDGRPVAVQAEADVAGIWYRRTHLAAVGHQPPQTWEDLAALGQALAGRGHAIPLTLPGGSRAGETATYCLLSLLASNGATILDREMVTLDTPAAAECLAFLRRLLDTSVIPAEAVSYDRNRPIRQLAHGQATLAFGGSYDAPALAAAAGVATDSVLDEFGFIGMPAGPHGAPATLAGGMVYGIFRQASAPHLAMRVLRDVTSTDALARMSRVTWQIAPRRSAVDRTAASSPLLRATGPLLGQAVVRPMTAQYPRVSAQLQSMLEAVLTGRMEPRAATARAAEMISAITGLPLA
ncbi:extracellular solute-binding protein [Micromonospora sp. NPDC005806]|uniref:extracellular solute-binding protein n=1 Tax=Micromonospora sp. NPDC005806 TaxID=3364234 RepID=UPI00367ACE36